MKNIVITGANRGIGLELTKNYSQNNNVYALCRKTSAELNELKNVRVIEGLDLMDEKSIRNTLEKCPNQIDILINNAGILQRTDLDSIATDGLKKINDQFQINALAPLIVTQAAKNKLQKGSKIALITSRMGSIGDNSSGTNYGYRMSKAALNAAGKSLSIDLKADEISVAILHPGWVKTDMTQDVGLYEVDQAASQLIARITELNLKNTGTFWHSDGQILEW